MSLFSKKKLLELPKQKTIFKECCEEEQDGVLVAIPCSYQVSAFLASDGAVVSLTSTATSTASPQTVNLAATTTVPQANGATLEVRLDGVTGSGYAIATASGDEQGISGQPNPSNQLPFGTSGGSTGTSITVSFDNSTVGDKQVTLELESPCGGLITIAATLTFV